jgi:sugar O-acyltransferase (sialic acid O-acetyltransferase NeuD family)
MRMDVVIFGVGWMARMVAYVLVHDSPHRPVAFTVHERFMTEAEFAGLPVRRFEDLERAFAPERVALLAPLGWTRMGGLRADVVAAGRAKGYRFISYVSSRALTWPSFVAGENCMVYDGVIVEPHARIGENCIIRAGATLSHDVELGEHCFVAPRASIGGAARIGANCVIGANGTVASGVRVAPRCFIAAGAVITADTQADGIYRGNPARRSAVTVDRFRTLNK